MAILLEEAFERTAARAAVQPDCDFIDRVANPRLEGEEERPAGVALVNWNGSGIELADVVVNIRKGCHLVG